MNTYNAYYSGKQIEVRADSSYAAQQSAAGIFGLRTKQSHRVAIVLAAKEATPVVHSTSEF